MKLKFITFSGANEHTDIDVLLYGFAPSICEVAEVGIQVSGKKASFGTARYWWLQTLFWRHSL